jgi:hypothetical protein
VELENQLNNPGPNLALPKRLREGKGESIDFLRSPWGWGKRRKSINLALKFILSVLKITIF